jgi:chromosome segregation ATPase
VFASSDAALKQSESLRIAQSRISELEAEMERLRRDNESLSTAGDTLRRRMDELLGKAENLEIQSRENQKIFDEEKKVLRGQAQSKERENADLRARMEELELRLESNFKKIRVRERELEHRLEIVKMESATLVSSKDKMILDLKRQIDQLSNENDFAKIKTQELFNQHKEKQETIRRVVRALRIALTILEGDEDNVVPLKKAE